MKKLIIFGGSGIGMIANFIASEMGTWKVVGFLNDVIPKGSKIGEFNKVKVVGKSSDYKKFLDKGCYFFFGYVGMKNEEQVFKKLQGLNIPKNRWANLIHPSAIIPKGFCKIGKGVLLAPLSQLSTDTIIEDNCIMLANSFLGHNSVMKKFSLLATNSVVGSNVIIGKGTNVGLNSAIKEKVIIGDYNLIGCGSVVLKSFKEKSLIIAGNPAKIITKK